MIKYLCVLLETIEQFIRRLCHFHKYRIFFELINIISNNIIIKHHVKYNYIQISALKLLNVPMLVTEQNPKSLGKIVSELDISGAKGVFAKTQFSMCTPEVSAHTS